MIRLTVFLVLAICLNVAAGMTFRNKRQSSDDNENNLDDRYGGDRPSWNRPRRPNQGGSQRPLFPQSNQWSQTNQVGNQWPRPNQGGNSWSQTNQGGNQWVQPNQGGNQWSQTNQGGNQGNQPQATTPASSGDSSSTTQSAEVQNCIRNCPVTPEYNPVCGTNQEQYTNPGRLECAQTCGVNVGLQRAGPCPTATTS